MAELRKLFGENTTDHIINELSHICTVFSYEPLDVFYSWEAYVQKMGGDIALDDKTVRDFKKDLQDGLERDSRQKSHVVHASTRKAAPTPRNGGGGGDVFGMLDGMVSATPSATRMPKRKANDFATPSTNQKSAKNGLNSSPNPTPTVTSNTSFADRPNPGAIKESLNAHIPALIAPATDDPLTSRVKLKAATELPKFAYRPMAMQLSSASEILDDRIDAFTDLIQASLSLPDTAFGNPAAQYTAEIVAVGRIASDQTGEARLNAASTVLETSRRMGAGLRVPLQVPPGIKFSFFPGKIVALRGTNVSGEAFVVSEVLELPLLPPAASTSQELDIHDDRLTLSSGETRPLGLLVASGPYTTSSTLDYTPLHALLTRCTLLAPDVLILCGPFLDLQHPAIAMGDFPSDFPPSITTLNEAFTHLIATPLVQLTQTLPNITILMIPSLRDAITHHPSYPQNKFPRAQLGLPKQCHVLTNPITLSINDMLVGISTQDVLAELRANYVSASTDGGDVLARLAGEVVAQRHFFPVFPASHSEEVGTVGASLDLGYLKLGEWLNVRPDVLVLPSVLSPFVKVRFPLFFPGLGG